MRTIKINDTCVIGGQKRFTLLAGPCAIENREMTLETARELQNICSELQIDFVFKASFDKANRTSNSSARGVGIESGLHILREVKEIFGVPIMTDVHETWQCALVAEVADILQIPAFLSRQTDLLMAAAKTGRIVNVKKGQFMAPWDMRNVIEKIASTGNEQILLCERGTSFGYNNLVVDMTSLVEMRQLGYPIVFDATHSVQKPSGKGSHTGGNREMVPHLMRAALAIGVDAIFAEIHPNPDQAISDGANQLYLSSAKEILQQAIIIDNAAKSLTNSLTATTVSKTTMPTNPFAKIKLLLSDVDGVMTDSGMYYSEQGDELKKFNAHDGMGLQLIKKQGIKVGIITSEHTHLVEQRFRKLQLDFLIQGKRDGGKLAAVQEICATEGISLNEVAYIGDDVNCFDLLSAVGVAACPADALPQIQTIPHIIHLRRKGGEGCVRELTEMILNTHKYA